jgi:ADP-heptose:LPS heptosyltransferase
MKPRLLIKCIHGLGDNVVLTAAVRDLLQEHHGDVSVNVDSTFPDVWKNFPGLDPTITSKKCDRSYIMANVVAPESNVMPHHYMMSYHLELMRFTGIQYRIREFGGLVIPDQGPSLMSGVCDDQPYWLLNAGVKEDIPLKGWPIDYYQDVVSSLRNEVLFVQIGSGGEGHPPLEGVIDLRGRTDVMDLIRLVHGAAGVLCGVTGLMHLAAAVPTRNGKRRAAVVIGGGREAPHWVQYPGHVYLNTCYTMDCCQDGGCWRNRPEGFNGQGPTCPLTRKMPSGQLVGECMTRFKARDVVQQVYRQAIENCSFLTGKPVIPDNMKTRNWDCGCGWYKKMWPGWHVRGVAI